MEIWFLKNKELLNLWPDTTYLIAGRYSRHHALLVIFNSFSWNLRLLARIRLYPNVELSKLLMVVITLWFENYTSWSLLLMERVKFRYDMAFISQQSSCWKDDTRWNLLLREVWPYFRSGLVLSVAIQTKSIQQITHRN